MDIIEFCCCKRSMLLCVPLNAILAPGYVNGRGDAGTLVPTADDGGDIDKGGHPYRPEDIMGVFKGVIDGTKPKVGGEVICADA